MDAPSAEDAQAALQSAVPEPAQADDVPATESEGLPPGSQIGEVPVQESPGDADGESKALAEDDDDASGNNPRPLPDSGLLAHWRRIRENLKKYDEAQESFSASDDGRPEGAPWERPEHYGFWGCFTRTLLGVMFRPRDFFMHVRCDMSLIRPALFYVLMSLIQALSERLWTLKAVRELMSKGTDTQTLALAEALMKSLNLPLVLLITPFLALFLAVFLAGIYHLMFRIVQPSRADFATTMRIVCYSAAPLILCIVPMYGSSIAHVWLVTATFLGCKYALNIPWTRTLLAMMPLFLLELAFVAQVSVLVNS